MDPIEFSCCHKFSNAIIAALHPKNQERFSSSFQRKLSRTIIFVQIGYNILLDDISSNRKNERTAINFIRTTDGGGSNLIKFCKSYQVKAIHFPT